MKQRVITTSEKVSNALGRNTKHDLSKAVKTIQPQLKAVDLELFNEATRVLKDFSKDQRSVLKQEMVNVLLLAHHKGVTTDLIPIDLVEGATPVPVEASLKPAKKKATKVKPVEEPEEVEDADHEEEEKPKKKTKVKAKAEPKEVVETIDPVMTVGIDKLPMVRTFPKKIDHDELGELVAIPDLYHDYESLVEALEEGKTIYFVSYWTKRQIKEYSYAYWKQIDPKVVAKGFPMNLDILMAVLPCETMDRVFAMSRLTEALFQFEGEDLDPVVDTDKNGKEYQVRVSAGMEFQLYAPADEVK